MFLKTHDNSGFKDNLSFRICALHSMRRPFMPDDFHQATKKNSPLLLFMK